MNPQTPQAGSNQTVQASDGTALNPLAVNLAKAIRQTESGNNYSATGDGGQSHGAYQFNKNNFHDWAAQYGLNPNDFSPVNQDKVAYARIEDLLKKGRAPSEVAAIWNGSKYEGGKYVPINPQYVDKVKKNYAAIVSGQRSAVPPQTTEGQGQPPSLGEQLGNRFNQLSSAITAPNDATQELAQGKMGTAIGDELARGLGIVAPVAGAVTDVAQKGLELIPGVKGIEGLTGKGVGALAQTAPGKSIAQGVQNFSQQNPELSKAIGDTATIASAIPVLKGVGAAKGLLGRALEGSSDSVLETVSPRLTGNALQDAIESQGTTNKGLLGRTTLNPSTSDQAVADAVKANVPKFNPSKPLTYNIAVTKNAVQKLASQLKSEVDAAGEGRIYSYRELGSYLRSIPRPTLLVGDMEKVYTRVLQKAMDIAQQDEGKISNLLDVRKKFDSFIRDEFPNLYTSDALTPMRVAVKNIRNGITQFTEDNLPNGTGLKEKLLTQHNLLNAIENMAGKAAKGGTKEIGSTIVGRTMAKHPVIRYGARAIGRGALLGTGLRGAEDLLP